MKNDKRDSYPVCYRCLVAGRVQGVFYRATTRYQAQQRDITGYAKNLPDGRVEVVACGEPKAVASLCEWLREGPEHAQVTGVACEVLDFQSFQFFSTA